MNQKNWKGEIACFFNDLPCWLHVVPTLDANVRSEEKRKEKKTIGGGPSSLSFMTRSPVGYHEGGKIDTDTAAFAAKGP